MLAEIPGPEGAAAATEDGLGSRSSSRSSLSSGFPDEVMLDDDDDDDDDGATQGARMEEGQEEEATSSQAYWKIVIATSSVFASSYCLTNIFPYVGFMVVRFTGNTNEEAGYHAGILASAFMFARIPTSVIWGFLADRVGRKPILLIGCLTLIIFQLMLGFAPSFEVAVLSRLFTGLFSGVVGTSKTVASELAATDATSQSIAMNIVSGAGSLGVILGPAFSGILYDPANQYPDSALAQVVLFREYPYLLPNIVSAFFALASFIGIWILLPETLPGAMSVTEFVCGSGTSSKKSQSAQYERVPTASADAGDLTDEGVELAPRGSRQHEEDIEQQQQQQMAETALGEPSSGGGLWDFLRVTYELWQREAIRKSCYMYGYYSFISIYSSELFPLWLMAKSEVGGFGFVASTIGGTISASAIILLLFQVFAFPSLSAIYKKPLDILRWTLLLTGAFNLVSPVLGVFEWPNHTVLLAVLVVNRAIGSILNIICFTQCNIMPNNSCAVHERATVNGIVMGLGSIFKALGPLCAGFSFAWSINNGMGFPFNFFFSFGLLAAICVVLAFYTYTMPVNLNTIRKPSVSTASTSSSVSLRSSRG